MRRVFTLLLGVMFISAAFGQKPSDVILKTDTKPIIDGVLDEGIWDNANVNNIDKPFTGETPTLGEPGETNWRALWDDDGIYIFVQVTDDVYVPKYVGTGDGYKYDKFEIYFDCNYILQDGVGAKDGKGHHQFTEDITVAMEDGKLQTSDEGVQFAFLVDAPNYTSEFFIPFNLLVTGDGTPVDKTEPIGFDISISDNDAIATPNNPVRNRAVWSNVGAINESWSNMDDAGIITLDGAEPGIPIDGITIAGGEITQDGQTLQMTIIELLPEDVTDSTVVWYVRTPEGSTGRAKISTKGVLTPIIDGEVEVYAMSPDKYAESNHVIVPISGQIVTAFEVSYIKNGDFSVAGKDTMLYWNAVNNAEESIVDGYLSVPATPQANRWDISVGQTLEGINDNNAADTYTFKFKAWGSNALDTIPLIIEDIVNGYPKNAIIGVPAGWAVGEGSDVALPITNTPQWFEFPVTFPKWVNNSSKYAFSFQIGGETGTFNFDSITMVNNADLAYITTSVSPIRSLETFKVYPNPAVNKLHVEFTKANQRVAIYNSVGVKMDEAMVTGTHHMFDVSRYAKGMYIVRSENGVMKFVK